MRTPIADDGWLDELDGTRYARFIPELLPNIACRGTRPTHPRPKQSTPVYTGAENMYLFQNGAAASHAVSGLFYLFFTIIQISRIDMVRARKAGMPQKPLF